MVLPCETCKHRTETRQAHRVFIGCNDSEKRKGFVEDNFFYRHRCSNYEPESTCKCEACKTVKHMSDCAVHNEPAEPNGACDCGAL